MTLPGHDLERKNMIWGLALFGVFILFFAGSVAVAQKLTLGARDRGRDRPSRAPRMVPAENATQHRHRTGHELVVIHNQDLIRVLQDALSLEAPPQGSSFGEMGRR